MEIKNILLFIFIIGAIIVIWVRLFGAVEEYPIQEECTKSVLPMKVREHASNGI